MVFNGTSKQKKVSNLDSYKGRTYGATIGFDIELKEDVLGVDSNTRTHFKLTTLVMIMQAHDHTFSFYGQESIGNGFLMQGLITVAQNNVSIRAIRQINNVNHNVTGKYKNHSINLEALLHYRLSDIMPTINITIIPNIGVRMALLKMVYIMKAISVCKIFLLLLRRKKY